MGLFLFVNREKGRIFSFLPHCSVPCYPSVQRGLTFTVGGGLLFCAVKSEQTYSDPNRAFKVSEIFLGWFYKYHSPSFHDRPGIHIMLQACSPLYSTHHTMNPRLGEVVIIAILHYLLLELISDPNSTLKVSEIFKQWFYE